MAFIKLRFYLLEIPSKSLLKLGSSCLNLCLGTHSQKTIKWQARMSSDHRHLEAVVRKPKTVSPYVSPKRSSKLQGDRPKCLLLLFAALRFWDRGSFVSSDATFPQQVDETEQFADEVSIPLRREMPRDRRYVLREGLGCYC